MVIHLKHPSDLHKTFGCFIQNTMMFSEHQTGVFFK